MVGAPSNKCSLLLLHQLEANKLHKLEIYSSPSHYLARCAAVRVALPAGWLAGRATSGRFLSANSCRWPAGLLARARPTNDSQQPLFFHLPPPPSVPQKIHLDSQAVEIYLQPPASQRAFWRLLRVSSSWGEAGRTKEEYNCRASRQEMKLSTPLLAWPLNGREQ